MKYRYYKPEDYIMVSEWWKSWDWAVLPELALPKTGIIVSNQGVDLCAGFLYKTDSCVCWAENFIANKEAPKELRTGSIDFLIEQLTIEAKLKGFLLMMSSVKHGGLIQKLVASGYEKEYETGMSNLVRVL